LEARKILFNKLCGEGLKVQMDVRNPGSLSLAWDNMDSAIEWKGPVQYGVKIAAQGIVHLTPGDLNLRGANIPDRTIFYADDAKIANGTLADLNRREKYLGKILAFGAYRGNVADTTDPDQDRGYGLFKMVEEYSAAAGGDEHEGLWIATRVLGGMHDKITSRGVNYYANDGLVPLQSALFLRIEDGTAFALYDKGTRRVERIDTFIRNYTQTKGVRIFSEETCGIKDHLDLLESTSQVYWNAITDEVLGLLPDPDAGAARGQRANQP
jgi:hypothetical protein